MKNIRKHEVTDGWKWYQEAWYDTEGARVDFFAVGLIIFAITAVLSRIPFLGGMAASFVFPLFQAGAFIFSGNWRTKKERQISTVFIAFQNQELMKSLLPLCYISVAFGAVATVLSGALLGGMGLLLASGVISILVMAVQGAVLYFAPPLVLVENMGHQEAMRLSIRAVLDNLPTFVITALIGFLLFLLGFATLGIGLIFLLPVYTYLPYLIYQSVFRD